MNVGPRVIDAVLAVALAATVGVVSVLVAVRSLPTPTAAALVAGLLLVHAAVLWRRRPAVVLGLGGAGFAVQAVASGLFVVLPAAVVFPVLLHSCCAHGGRRVQRVALVVGLVAAGVAAARFLTDPAVRDSGIAPPAALLVGLLVAVVVAAWSLGVLAGSRRTDLELLAERARRDERERIARELHDIVAHSLAVIVSQARGGRFVVRTEPAVAAETLRVVEETGRRALTDMRGLLGVLRADDPADRAPQPGLDELDELVDRVRATGLRVTVDVPDPAPTVGSAVGLTAYRVVQEALTNVVRHAGDATARVRLRCADGELTVEVTDDGPPAAIGGGGHGLAGLAERVRAVGGTLDAGSRAGGGFAVVARLPVPEVTG